MNVYIVKGLGEFLHSKVMHLLHEHEGPIKFITASIGEEEEQRPSTGEQTINYPIPPLEELITPICEEIRKQNYVSPDELVVIPMGQIHSENLLVNYTSCSRYNDFLINVNSKVWCEVMIYEQCFIFAFQIALAVLKKVVFNEYEEVADHTEYPAHGCALKFYLSQKDIILQLKSADFCNGCLERIKSSGASPLIFDQISKTLESIRTEMLLKQKYLKDQIPSRLRIFNHKTLSIIFSDYNDLEIHFSPLEKTVFLTFLKYPEGLTITEFYERKLEVAKLYRKVSNSDDIERINSRIENLSNPLSNSLSEKISKIKSKLIAELSEKVAKFYIIEGPNGGKKRIKIDRNLVEWAIN